MLLILQPSVVLSPVIDPQRLLHLNWIHGDRLQCQKRRWPSFTITVVVVIVFVSRMVKKHAHAIHGHHGRCGRGGCVAKGGANGRLKRGSQSRSIVHRYKRRRGRAVVVVVALLRVTQQRLVAIK